MSLRDPGPEIKDMLLSKLVLPGNRPFIKHVKAHHSDDQRSMASAELPWPVNPPRSRLDLASSFAKFATATGRLVSASSPIGVATTTTQS